jgi:hypothetical protein
MRIVACLVVVLLALGTAGPSWAAGCHGDGNSGGCSMDGCPGSGQTMVGVSGKIAYIGPKRDLVKVTVAKSSGGTQTLQLLVHPDCPNRGHLIGQIKQLKVGQTLKGTCYKLNGKTYLCQIGTSASCH